MILITIIVYLSLHPSMRTLVLVNPCLVSSNMSHRHHRQASNRHRQLINFLLLCTIQSLKSWKSVSSIQNLYSSLVIQELPIILCRREFFSHNYFLIQDHSKFIKFKARYRLLIGEQLFLRWTQPLAKNLSGSQMSCLSTS